MPDMLRRALSRPKNIDVEADGSDEESAFASDSGSTGFSLCWGDT